jgi:predicted MFS family arabinose efflux permease
VLAAPIRAELGIGNVAVFGSFTVGLFASGFAAPTVGRLIDAHGGRSVLAGGSALGALALMVLALAQGIVSLIVGFVLAGLAMAGCLYDPAFATLHRISGNVYRKAVTALTLFGGFASTVFWPLAQLLLDASGWRTAFGVFAALNLLVCVPVHWLMLPRARPAHAHADSDRRATGHAIRHPAVFAWLATALALGAFLASAFSAHVIGLLTSTGLSARDAVLASSLVGAMQVAGRVVEFTVSRRVHPLTVGTLAFVLLALAAILLTQVHGVWVAALGFAALYGWSNGIMTIVRGTVPAELLGHSGYGALLGRLAQPQFIARAIAPLALTLVFVIDPTRQISLYALAGIALVALAAYQIALRARQRLQSR